MYLEHKCLSSLVAGFDASKCRYLILQRIIPVRCLAGMSVACSTLDWFCLIDIDIVSGRVLHRILPVGDLVVIERKRLFRLPPRIIGEHRNRPVVAVVVNGPLGKDGVRLLSAYGSFVGFVVCVIRHGVAVYLPCIDSSSLQYCARPFGLSDTRGGGGGRPGTVVQVEQNHLMAKLRESADGSAATIFRIAGVAAGHDQLQLLSFEATCAMASTTVVSKARLEAIPPAPNNTFRRVSPQGPTFCSELTAMLFVPRKMLSAAMPLFKAGRFATIAGVALRHVAVRGLAIRYFELGCENLKILKGCGRGDKNTGQADHYRLGEGSAGGGDSTL